MKNLMILSLLLFAFGFTSTQAQSSINVDTEFYYELTNQFLGNQVALDAVGGGQRPAMKAANGGTSQKWIISAIGNGYYRMTTILTGSNVALEGGAPNGGALMNGKANQSGQMWKFVDVGNGYVKLINMFTEKENYAFEGGAKDGGSLLTKYGPYSGQHFKLVKKNKINEIKVISAQYGVPGRLANVSAKVQEIANSGEAKFWVRNHILGADPATGVHKSLTLVYTINGVRKEQTVTERGYLTF